MPSPLVMLPEIDLGNVVSGDLVLRNVVIDTGSSRISKPDITQPALPLDGTRPPTPRPIINLPPANPPNSQYSADLVIPDTLPADAYGVLIDNVNRMVVKANPQETAQFIQEGMYFIGSFDSDTADAVIEDMLANPIPTETQLINQAFDEGFPLAVSAYIMGQIIFEAYANARHNSGIIVPLEKRIQDAYNTPVALPTAITPSVYPKVPVIYFNEFENDFIVSKPLTTNFLFNQGGGKLSLVSLETGIYERSQAIAIYDNKPVFPRGSNDSFVGRYWVFQPADRGVMQRLGYPQYDGFYRETALLPATGSGARLDQLPKRIDSPQKINSPLQQISAKSFLEDQLKAKNFKISGYVDDDSGQGIRLDVLVNNQAEEDKIWDFVTQLYDNNFNVGYFLKLYKPDWAQQAVNVPLTDLSQYSSPEQVQEVYKAITQEIINLENNFNDGMIGEGYTLEELPRPLTDQELNNAIIKNEAVFVSSDNPNFNLPPREPLQVGYATFTYKDGTSITKQIPIKQDAQTIDAQKEGYRKWYAQWARIADKLNEMTMTKTSVGGYTREGTITEEHRQQAKAYQEYYNYFLLRDISLGSIVSPTKGYPSAGWLEPEDVETYEQYRNRIGKINQPVVETVLPSTLKKPTARMKQLQEEQTLIGQQLGVPANCKPISPQIVPPATIPANCVPIPPIPPMPPQLPVPPQPPPPVGAWKNIGIGGGFGKGSISGYDYDITNGNTGVTVGKPSNASRDPNIPAGGVFILDPKKGELIHAPSGRRFTIQKNEQGQPIVGSYIAGTGKDDQGNFR